MHIPTRLPPINLGYDFFDPSVWSWLDQNTYKFDIDVVSVSINFYNISGFDLYANMAKISKYVSSMSNKGVFMITAIGNDGEYVSEQGPNLFPEFHSVSSIDHENRGAMWTSKMEYSIHILIQTITQRKVCLVATQIMVVLHALQQNIRYAPIGEKIHNRRLFMLILQCQAIMYLYFFTIVIHGMVSNL